MAFTAAQRRQYFAKKSKEKKHEKVPFVPLANPSVFQRAIFDSIAHDTCHLVVQACAGGGKSTTLLNGLTYIPVGKTAIFVAFGKDIADELKARNPNPAVEVSTTHSFGAKISYKNGAGELDKQKVFRILARMLGEAVLPNGEEDEDKAELFIYLDKAVSLCKANLIKTTVEVSEMIDSYDLEFISQGKRKEKLSEEALADVRAEFIKNVLEALCISTQEIGTINFDDMIYLPIAKNWSIPKFDMVLVDETQDLNKCQLEMARQMIKPGGRIIAIGDNFQALFGFRGADMGSMPRMVSELSAKELPLSTTYRCGKKIVEYVHRMIPDMEGFQAGENNIEGEVIEDSSFDKLRENVQPGDFILSRVNAPLMGLAMNLLRNGKPCQILGRDLGNYLKFFVKNSKATSIPDLLDYLDRWEEAQFKSLNERKNPPKNLAGIMENIGDKAACIRAIAMDCLDMKDFNKKVDKLFSNDDKANKKHIILSSVHKIKGAESDNVWVLASTLKTGKNQEECNIAYVAFSRAKKVLNIVQGSLRN